MGGKVTRRSTASKSRSSTSKHDSKKNTNAVVKQAAKKHKQWSKDRSERAREVFDRDTDLLYNVLGKQTTLSIVTPSTSPNSDPVLALTECIQDLGK
ncbi:hypothetical protein PAXINDRAFT_8255 [Paxillus involutus ATCC 200175]|nr:hypothetical protein PAXINDRAFT_8255 [Paxillus involutus ATCC 200175]